jgi:hypothetical protein
MAIRELNPQPLFSTLTAKGRPAMRTPVASGAPMPQVRLCWVTVTIRTHIVQCIDCTILPASRGLGRPEREFRQRAQRGRRRPLCAPRVCRPTRPARHRLHSECIHAVTKPARCGRVGRGGGGATARCRPAGAARLLVRGGQGQRREQATGDWKLRSPAGFSWGYCGANLSDARRLERQVEAPAGGGWGRPVAGATGQIIII